MRCKKCGSEWKTNARANLIIRCPFCGAELDKEKEDKLTFTNAKEALRYIIKTYGVDVIIDGLQLKSLLDEFIPTLKQEKKVFMDAYEQGVCNALYLAHDEPEIDKCIAILQSIKVLTQDACMAEKWACYVVETLVYALNWNVPMFGMTPNIHMYQIPEKVDETGENGGQSPILVDTDEVWVSSSDAEESSMWDQSPVNSNNHKDNFVLPSRQQPQLSETSGGNAYKQSDNEQPTEEPKIESPVIDFTNESENQPTEEPKIESPVIDFTDESENQPTEEPKIESPVIDFTDESENQPTEEPKIESPVIDFTDESDNQPTEEPKIESPVIDFTDESENQPT
ncbi:MAG: hypothetical protein ACI4XP_05730, partial [Acutalibacteraceae bacterium]